MKIRITAGGIYGRDGEIPIGAEFDVEEAPEAWAGRFEVVGKAPAKDAVAVTNPAGSFDRDGDGKPGGSLPHDPPALTGKNKAQLLDIAAAEGVTIEDGATNADIIAAIELAREAAA